MAASRVATVAAPVGARSVSFALTDDQKAYQKLARDFVANEVIPKAKELDQTMAYPEELFKKVRAGGGTCAASVQPALPSGWRKGGCALWDCLFVLSSVCSVHPWALVVGSWSFGEMHGPTRFVARRRGNSASSTGTSPKSLAVLACMPWMA
jgi:hypothetical protein